MQPQSAGWHTNHGSQGWFVSHEYSWTKTDTCKLIWGNTFCRKHEVIPVSEQNDDAFSWLCLRDKGNIYLSISYLLFFHGVIFLLATEWDMGVFPCTCPSLHLPGQIQVIIKYHSHHLTSPRKPKFRRNHGACHCGQYSSNSIQEPAFPKMSSSYKEKEMV